MRKILVVGCGGSGGATLGFMMDQLKAELAPYGISKLPSGWQFVHVDVPTVADGGAMITTVADQGGSYVSTAPAAGANYSTVDGVLAARVGAGGDLGGLGTWLPREPQAITVPVSQGAGQLRAVGRALTLAQAPTVLAGLQAAWGRMFTSDADADMYQVGTVARERFGRYEQNGQPLVLVVSSMAGGAGASMALDICRILTAIPNLDPGLMGVFMFSPDIFDPLPPAARGGVRANGLAMLGEIVASQTRAANAHDVSILQSLGIATDATAIPFARVFPVGRTMGVSGTLFGDGSMSGVYRGLGRGLAALIASDRAMGEFTAFDLTNATPTGTNRRYFGWGEASNELQWGSFGFASMSMGRDRYRHYAGQRLARATVDRLTRGHRRDDSTATDEVVLGALIDSQWSSIQGRLRLPSEASPQALATWYTAEAFPPPQIQSATKAIVDTEILIGLAEPAGMDAQQWLQALHGLLAARRATIHRAVADAAYRWAFDWAPRFEQRVIDEISLAIAQFGLPYARAVLGRIQTLVEHQLLPGFQRLAEYAVPDPATVPPGVATPLSAMKGAIHNPEGIKQFLVEGLVQQLRQAVHSRGAESMTRVLGSLSNDALAPLRDALSEALTVLVTATEAAAVGVGLADVSTSMYAAWPSDRDARVPDRFDVAHNEILLTPASGFDAQYSSDVRASVSDAYGAGHEDAQATLLPQIVSGVWAVGAGEEPPGGLLSRQAPWRAPYFNTDPTTGGGLVPSRAGYRFHLRTKDVLSRAMAFVSRRGESFDAYCSVSLKSFVTGNDGAPESELARRHDLVVQRFRETLNAAMPLTAVSEQAVVAIHGEGVSYRYKFSGLPLRSTPDLAERLAEIVRMWPNIDPTTVADFPRALTDDDHATKIDAFGSYKCYSPVVFSGLLEPVKEQWAGLQTFARASFWGNRRSRPLAASLPLGNAERRAMVAGWYLGRVTGRIRVPAAPFTDPVRIWEAEAGSWIDFPNPLLTPPERFKGGAYDWLPAVLESILVAIAQAQNPPALASLAPYRVLRAYYDDSDEQPTDSGGLAADLSGQSLLAEWLRDGTTPLGGTNAFDGDTPDGRHAAVREWLTRQRADTQASFGAPLKNRTDAANAPIFRDLAADAEWAFARIDALLDPALATAEAGSGFGSGLVGGGMVL